MAKRSHRLVFTEDELSVSKVAKAAAKADKAVDKLEKVEAKIPKKIKEKMVLSHITNLEAYLRKMAVDGVVVRLSLPELREMISLLRYMSNNINQIAKRLNETGRAYDSDFYDVQKRQDELWVKANEIITKLAEL